MGRVVLETERYRFSFERDEPRFHVWAGSIAGEAKYWIEPAIELALNLRMSSSELREVERWIAAHLELLRDAWLRRGDSIETE